MARGDRGFAGPAGGRRDRDRFEARPRGAPAPARPVGIASLAARYLVLAHHQSAAGLPAGVFGAEEAARVGSVDDALGAAARQRRVADLIHIPRRACLRRRGSRSTTQARHRQRLPSRNRIEPSYVASFSPLTQCSKPNSSLASSADLEPPVPGAGGVRLLVPPAPIRGPVGGCGGGCARDRRRGLPALPHCLVGRRRLAVTLVQAPAPAQRRSASSARPPPICPPPARQERPADPLGPAPDVGRDQPRPSQQNPEAPHRCDPCPPAAASAGGDHLKPLFALGLLALAPKRNRALGPRRPPPVARAIYLRRDQCPPRLDPCPPPAPASLSCRKAPPHTRGAASLWPAVGFRRAGVHSRWNLLPAACSRQPVHGTFWYSSCWFARPGSAYSL